MKEMLNDIPAVIDYIDKISILLQTMEIENKEVEKAIDKLKEAVFWLTYANDEIGEIR